LGVSSIGFTQSIEQNVVSTSGNNHNQINGSIEYTVGEPVIETIENGDNTMTQGFQQSYFVVSTVENNITSVPFLSIYPNPTMGDLNIKFNNANQSYYCTIDIFDLNGKKLQSITNYTESVLIKLDQYAVSTYFLLITDNETQETIKYKVQKIK
jgi:hypothetical protein